MDDVCTNEEHKKIRLLCSVRFLIPMVKGMPKRPPESDPHTAQTHTIHLYLGNVIRKIYHFFHFAASQWTTKIHHDKCYLFMCETDNGWTPDDVCCILFLSKCSYALHVHLSGRVVVGTNVQQENVMMYVTIWVTANSPVNAAANYKTQAHRLVFCVVSLLLADSAWNLRAFS